MNEFRSADCNPPVGQWFILSFFCLFCLFCPLFAGCRAPAPGPGPEGDLALTPGEVLRARALACFSRAVALSAADAEDGEAEEGEGAEESAEDGDAEDAGAEGSGAEDGDAESAENAGAEDEDAEGSEDASAEGAGAESTEGAEDADVAASRERKVAALLREAWECDPSSRAIAECYGGVLEKAGRHSEAFDVYRAFRENAPDDREMAAAAFRTAVAAGKNDAAARLVRELMAREPDDRELAKAAILFYYGAGKDRECFELARGQFKRYGDETPALLLLGRACRLLEEAAEREKTGPDAEAGPGSDAEAGPDTDAGPGPDAGKPEDAAGDAAAIRARERAYLDAARRLVPEGGGHDLLLSEILLLTADCQCAAGDLRGGFALFCRARALNPPNLLGLQLFSQFLERDAAALAAFRAGAPDGPEDAFARRLVIALVDQRQGRREAALDGFRALAESETARGRLPCEALFSALALQLEACGKTEESIAVQRRAVAVHPYSAPLKNNLAFALACGGGDLDEAGRLAREALREEPESAVYLDTYGWILFKKKLPYEAIQFLLMAAGRERDPEIDAHLREALLSVGRAEEARLIDR